MLKKFFKIIISPRKIIKVLQDHNKPQEEPPTRGIGGSKGKISASKEAEKEAIMRLVLFNLNLQE